LDLNNKVLWTVEVFGVDVWITQSVFNTWLIMAALCLFAAVVRIKLRKFKAVPRGFQNVIELAVESFDKIVKSAAGEEFMVLGNWFFMVFAFIFVANISGIVGLRPPTADWNTAFALALATFVLIQAMGIRHRKGKYLKSFIEPNFVFLPLNIIGELSRPISLSFRLFGNVLAGYILSALVYDSRFLRILLPVALHAYFDLFAGLLQTYIFCVLSLTFIGNAASAAEPSAVPRTPEAG